MPPTEPAPLSDVAPDSAALAAENERFRAAFADLMSVRDQFAACALRALLTRVNVVSGDYVTNAEPIDAARDAYRYADAMMLTRRRTTTTGATNE